MGKKKVSEVSRHERSGEVTGDAVAMALEQAGLYRRAARRWLEVLDSCSSGEVCDWLAARRHQCLVRACRPAPEPDCFGDVCRAAEETQKRMGLRGPSPGYTIMTGKPRRGRAR
ncbi:TPA: PerC family transcriptional regulator [Klebsiella oxytoca]|uniref:PerC family transcriptional regulator n=1 Tax=Klebsiella oxytoca TaxID=571 RepID=A0AAN5LEW6_KLEOX|nr:PerC family transcriptional regulator [Klebsiella oxytoca]